ncbi:hypothetical protein K2173_002724 [Erythroxylum novogranatense]|uniref:RRM domain-containing protein n=1 Tax=Erythroxylum novogranatense TaxID=1862640 RepID=A0AAV8TTJ6_9ROSI|nr:hypothetical protein K2173_002724 [Erythroxylum novogranatense]
MLCDDLFEVVSVPLFLLFTTVFVINLGSLIWSCPVGNIPYDATEEQLIDICREVGPVVSFRLVIDRETGKPKGYGFCEYKDEETALSARRNLQGYVINGRQLRVDFAENDKNADRNREQGRAGPGLTADSKKQVGGLSAFSESGHDQPIGLHIAITAATVMAGALGGAQTSVQSNQNGLRNQPALASDPLTLHLAKMSRNQLNEMISEMKVLTSQNREAARQLLVAKPQLSKALFQAQIMLGLVTPQVLQMANTKQPLVQTAVSSFQQAQQPAVQSLPGVVPLTQRLPQPTLVPRMQDGQFSVAAQNSVVHNHFSAPHRPSLQPRAQIQQHSNNNVHQQPVLPGQSGVPQFHSSVRAQAPVATSSSLNQQVQRPLPGQIGTFRHNSQTALPSIGVQSSLISRPSTADSLLQPGPLISSGISGPVSKDVGRPAQVHDSTSMNLQTSSIYDSREPSSQPSKLLKLEDSKSISVSMGASGVAPRPGPSQASTDGPLPTNSITKSEDLKYSDKQSDQPMADLDPSLLQQVLNLTPEQLSSLPPEHQQQVIQLQEALRGGQIWPS